MITAIVQARTGSTRLPNKIFVDLCGKPLIWHIINRLKYSKLIDKIVVATTTNPNDEKLVKWCNDNNIPAFRGSEDDVLSRFFFCAKEHKSSIIVRITADDPFKDPKIIDQVIDVLINEALDFAYNNNPPSFPEGLDTEVFTYDALKIAYDNAKDIYEREHVTQYMYRHPEIFKQKNISYKENISYLRWTLDTSEDYILINNIYSALYQDNELFYMNDILNYLNNHPELSKINSKVQRSAMYS